MPAHDSIADTAVTRSASVGRPLSVVHVVTTLAVGGLEKVVLDLVRCRTSASFDARVICLDSAGVLESGFTAVGVPVEMIGTQGSVAQRVLATGEATACAETRRPAHPRPASSPPRRVGSPLGRSAGGDPHAARPGPSCKDRVAALSRVATVWTDRFVVVSEDAAKAASEIERAGRETAGDSQWDRPARFPFDPGASTAPRGRAVTVGRLDPIKDQSPC